MHGGLTVTQGIIGSAGANGESDDCLLQADALSI